MSPRPLRLRVLTALSLVLACSCSTAPKAKKLVIVNPEPKSVTTQIDFTSLVFEKGQVKLTDEDRHQLNKLAQKISSTGKVVDDIKIITWSDRQVKTADESTNSEIILARQRAESIKKYLERNLMEEEDIDFYNMSENPERFTSYLKRKGVPVEQALSQEGENVSPDGHGLVFIEYQATLAPSKI